MQILPLIRARFEQALDGWVAEPAEHARRIAVARDPRHGDYQANIAMPLSKSLCKKPMEIAGELVDRLSIDDLCHPPEIAAPGFINLRLRDEFLAAQLSAALADQRLAVGQVTARTYVIDYSSPNVAKPMHVGHIRSTVIGDALARILRFLGHQVISDNHLGDWGTQFGMIIYGYKHFLDQAKYEKNPVAELSRLYRVVQQVIGYQAAEPELAGATERLASATEKQKRADAAPADAPKRNKEVKAAAKEVRAATEALSSLNGKVNSVKNDPQLLTIAQEHPELEQRAQAETVKLHQGDAENLDLWKQFLPLSIAEIDSVYKRLDVRFDTTYGESFYHPMLGALVDKLSSSGMAVESDGATCVFLDDFEAPMIIRKRDGAFLYATTDLATIEYRMEHFRPDAILYVVDHRQGEHFSKIFAAARAIGYDQVELQHVSFGTVLGPDGRPFKTRSGTVVGLDTLLDEAVERAYQVVCDPERLQKAGLEMTDEEKRQVASTVGLGAIKYADLSHNRSSDYKFDIDAMVQLEGNTSAYIQYMVARTKSIIRKSGMQLTEKTIDRFPLQITQPAERKLALQLLQFEDALHQSIEEYYPSVLAGYLYDVAKQFATFFEQCHVLNASSEDLKISRLAICYATARVLRQGLSLLGIDVVERM